METGGDVGAPTEAPTTEAPEAPEPSKAEEKFDF
jgi:hypothetical protein